MAAARAQGGASRLVALSLRSAPQSVALCGASHSYHPQQSPEPRAQSPEPAPEQARMIGAAPELSLAAAVALDATAGKRFASKGR